MPSGLSQEQFRDAIRKERAYELCFEGNRKQDLIRWGIYAKSVVDVAPAMNVWCDGASSYILAAQYTDYVDGEESKHNLQPIPQRELDLMTEFEQNPKWGK